MKKPALALLVLSMPMIAIAAHLEEDYLVVDNGGLGEYWNFTRKMPYPSFPNSALRKHIEACVAVGFAVESDGRPSNVGVLRVETSRPSDADETEGMKSAIIDAISGWRFEPAEANAARRPLYTYTVISMAYSAPGTLAGVAKQHAEKVTRSCEIPDFVATALRGDLGPLAKVRR